MKAGFGSVRFRLTAWYVLALLLIILVFSSGIYTFIRSSLMSQMDMQLNEGYSIVETVFSEEPGEMYEIERHGQVRLFRISLGDQIDYQTPGWELAQLDDALVTTSSEMLWSWKSPEGRIYRLKTGSIVIWDQTHLITVALDSKSIYNTLHILALTLIICLPGVLLLAVVGGYFLAGRVLSPVDAMANKAQEITAERLSERLPVENPNDEFGRLAIVFNDTLTRLQDSFDRLQRFTADASHELRTPLTALRSVGEVGLREDLDPASYHEVIGSMLEETDHLTLLVDNLLTLTRADSGRISLVPEPVELGLLARDVVECLRVLAEEKEQALDIEVKQAINVKIDRITMRRALMNLLDNAIKYTPAKGHIRVVVEPTADNHVKLEIIDNGPGISREHHENIFKRFTRIEQGRSSETGGTGLGLAIVRYAVEVNGGRIELVSEVNQGSTFRIILPCAEKK
ncbi:MAG: HAMP domain-containing protein [Planctomycetes bacterium]|nr:HAMP domain-containing protein [Planctomycetota bacterium]